MGRLIIHQKWKTNPKNAKLNDCSLNSQVFFFFSFNTGVCKITLRWKCPTGNIEIHCVGLQLWLVVDKQDFMYIFFSINDSLGTRELRGSIAAGKKADCNKIHAFIHYLFNKHDWVHTCVRHGATPSFSKRGERHETKSLNNAVTLKEVALHSVLQIVSYDP